MPVFAEHAADFDGGEDDFITGTAFWDYDTDIDFSADVGGVDGSIISECSLRGVMVGKLFLWPIQIVDAVGADVLEKKTKDAVKELTQRLLNENLPYDTAPTLIAAE